MKYNLTISIVLYETKSTEIQKILGILSGIKLTHKIYVIDNSPTNSLKAFFKNYPKVEYSFSKSNIGFGSAHNTAFSKIKGISEFHLVLNSDVDFNPNILDEIYSYMKSNDKVGLLAPKVLNQDNTIQYSAKLLPHPLNVIVRRFVPFKWIKQKFDYTYELQFSKHSSIMEIPYLTGCFMFINTKVFQKIKGFDERFFMYPEDIDLTRRIHKHFKTIYYPRVSIYHNHERGSYKQLKLLYFHIVSMIKYFNKWGWICDKERKRINKKTLSQFF